VASQAPTSTGTRAPEATLGPQACLKPVPRPDQHQLRHAKISSATTRGFGSDGIHAQPREVLVGHANAALTPRARLRLARLIVDDGRPVARAAERFQVA
jgi:hypothetical protein